MIYYVREDAQQGVRYHIFIDDRGLIATDSCFDKLHSFLIMDTSMGNVPLTKKLIDYYQLCYIFKFKLFFTKS